MTGRHKKIGDVYEIKTSKGLSYFQYTHEYTKPPKWGSLIRVLDGFYQERPSMEEIYAIVNKKHRFQTFCFLQAALKESSVEFVENMDIPEKFKKFPIFKGTNSMPKRDPLDKIWWLWDGEKSWRVGKLTIEEQMKYPVKELCDAAALIGNIEKGKSFSDILC
jgi:hypothetical protein